MTVAKLADHEQKSSTNIPEGWVNISFNINYDRMKSYHLCPTRVEKLKIPRDYQEQRKDIGERLTEIIEEIVQAQSE